MKLFILFILLINIVFISCDSSLDINADYKNIPVVYSLLDKNDTIQYIKLNKTFLGDESVSNMAQVSDSLNYENAVVNVLKYKNNSVVSTFSFEKTDTISKDDGFFANDNNIIYIYKGKIINEGEKPDDYKFALDIDIPDVGKLSSETKVVSDVIISAPLGYNSPSAKNELTLYTNHFLSPEYKFTSGKNSGLFEYYLEFLYYEKINGEYKFKSISHSEGSKSTGDLSGGVEFDFALKGEVLYKFVNEELSKSTNEKVFYAIRYKFMSAGEDLSMYIDLTKPSYGIVQEKPSFTNIVNGWGLFSSRTSTYSPYKKLDLSSLNYLSTGEITNSLNFKDYTGTGNFYTNNRDLDIDNLYIN